MPSTEPIERSTLRVTITIVSPIASSAMIEAPDSSCCRLVALTKRWLSIVVAPTTIASASTMPSSRKRSISSASVWECARRSTAWVCSAITVTPPPPPPPSRRGNHVPPTSPLLLLGTVGAPRRRMGKPPGSPKPPPRGRVSRGRVLHEPGRRVHDRVLVRLLAQELARDAPLEEDDDPV